MVLSADTCPRLTGAVQIGASSFLELGAGMHLTILECETAFIAKSRRFWARERGTSITAKRQQSTAIFRESVQTRVDG